MSKKPPQWQPPQWQPIHVNHDLYALLIQSELLCAGIHDTESYFRIWKVRIIVWIVICAYVGYINGGVTAMLLAAPVGLVMPLAAPWMGYVLLAILLQLVAYMAGVCFLYLFVWALLTWLFG